MRKCESSRAEWGGRQLMLAFFFACAAPSAGVSCGNCDTVKCGPHALTRKRANSKSKHSENPTFFFLFIRVCNFIFTLVLRVTMSLSYAIQDGFHIESPRIWFWWFRELHILCSIVWRCYHSNVSHAIAPRTQRTREHVIQFGSLSIYIWMCGGRQRQLFIYYYVYFTLYTCLTQIPCDMNFNRRPHQFDPNRNRIELSRNVIILNFTINNKCLTYSLLSQVIAMRFDADNVSRGRYFWDFNISERRHTGYALSLSRILAKRSLLSIEF